jgi:hypothetical protein
MRKSGNTKGNRRTVNRKSNKKINNLPARTQNSASEESRDEREER